MSKKKMLCLICLNLLLTKQALAEKNALPVDLGGDADSSIPRPKISAEESNRRLKDARLLFERGKPDAAIYMLQQLAKDDPENYDVLLELGRIAVGAKNWAYSITVFRQASLMKPEDVEVRMILMDVYKAYQMPIQEIIVAKEVLALESENLVAMKRLAFLYHEQAMLEEEVGIRQNLIKLKPADYENTKQLAVSLDKSAQLWEAAKAYELIRIHHPSKLDDMYRLAAIYDTLGENFREAEVLDHIAENGGSGGGWMESHTEQLLREKNGIRDPFTAGLTLSVAKEDTMKTYTVGQQVAYTRVNAQSSVDFGIKAGYKHSRHEGRRELEGKVAIDSATVELTATKYFSGEDYILDASVGVLHDEVNGQLRSRFGLPVVTGADFPSLIDSSFNSYGGTMPIGSVTLTAQPNRNIIYTAGYAHNIMEEFDARLVQLTHDTLSLGVDYNIQNDANLVLKVDNSYISDGNYRLHAMTGGYYNLWASAPVNGLRGRRKSSFGHSQTSFIRIGYEVDFFSDREDAEHERYESFVSTDYRYKGILSGQAKLMDLGADAALLFNVKLSYGAGRTREYMRSADARIFYFMPDAENELGIMYGYQDEDSDNQPLGNTSIGGESSMQAVSLYTRWFF